jgi:hypothetical protein
MIIVVEAQPRWHQPVIFVSGRENSVSVCKIGFGFGSASCLQLRKSNDI